jgi:glycine cleavage system aminomethyltransferase T
MALRESVAISRLDTLAHVRIRGDDAWERLDRLLPGRLKLRDGQLLLTLLLNDDGTPLADAYLGWDDDEFFLLVDGLDAAALLAYLRQHLRPEDGLEVEDRSTTHAVVALDGPYAWELLGAGLDPEAVGLPYLSFYHGDGWLCYRAGRTGEFGYGIIVRAAEAAALEARLEAAGRPFDTQRAGIEALDQCALENWFFNVRREGRAAVTPIELQLQWRVAYDKDYVGVDALRRRRQEGPRQRLTTLLAPADIAIGDDVTLHGRPVGRIVNAGFSPVRGDWVALALLDVAYAHPGIAAFRCGVGVPCRSVVPPVLNNRSLAVSPQLHSYQTREEIARYDIVRYRA